MNYFENVKKNFGFGCMRLPMNGEEVDLKEFSQDRRSNTEQSNEKKGVMCHFIKSAPYK